jgi:hypothetical protein
LKILELQTSMPNLYMLAHPMGYYNKIFKSFIHQNNQTQHLVYRTFIRAIELQEFVAHKYNFTPKEPIFHICH